MEGGRRCIKLGEMQKNRKTNVKNAATSKSAKGRKRFGPDRRAATESHVDQLERGQTFCKGERGVGVDECVSRDEGRKAEGKSTERRKKTSLGYWVGDAGG